MHNIRERELEIVDQTQTPRYVSRFEPLLYVPVFTQKISTISSTQGTSTEDLSNTTLEYTTPLSKQQQPLYKRQGTKPYKINLTIEG